MRRHPVRAAGWVIGAVVGVAVGIPVGLQTQAWQETREDTDMAARIAAFERPADEVPEPVDVVRDLLEQDSLVVIDPLLEGRISAEHLQRAEAVLADSPVPARIAFLARPGVDSGYTTYNAGPQWWANVGEKGHYAVLFEGGLTDPGAVGLERQYVGAETKGQPGPALVRLAEEMATWEAEPLPTEPEPPSDFDQWGGTGGGLAAAGLLGGIVVAPLFLLLRWFVGSRRGRVT